MCFQIRKKEIPSFILLSSEITCNDGFDKILKMMINIDLFVHSMIQEKCRACHRRVHPW